MAGDDEKPEKRSTLLRPPPPEPNKAPIENTLEVTELGVLGPDIFTNTRPQWHPPGNRGIYGGSVIAQTLASAQKTVPAGFYPHSMHCYFILAGSPDIPILYHVERVRDGRSFATRTVQARQRGKCIFTTTISFVKEGAGGDKQIHHEASLPPDAAATVPRDNESHDPDDPSSSPLQSVRVPMTGVGAGREAETLPSERNCRMWSRARGRISEEGGMAAHLNALAYLTDSHFIGTVPRIHGLWRHRTNPEDVSKLPEAQRRRIEDAQSTDGFAESDWQGWVGRPKVGMMVSLDHSIYFHSPRKVRADEWMFMESNSPWSGDGRGVVMQRIFSRDGTLLASCVQEGLVRLRQEDERKEAKL